MSGQALQARSVSFSCALGLDAPGPLSPNALPAQIEEAPRRHGLYFATARDFCDHLLFYEDGTFEHGSRFAWGPTSGCGEWTLQPSQRGAVVLRLRWQPGPGGGESLEEELTSSGSGDALRFCAEQSPLSLSHVGGEVLGDAFCQPVGAATGADSAALAPEPAAPPAALDAASAGVSGAKRGLVFSSVGSQCLPVIRDHWLAQPALVDFDVALVFYKEATSPVYKELLELKDALPCPVELVQRPGMKWPNFRQWMDAQGGAEAVAAKYDYIWVVDDDVRLSTEGIRCMFQVLREHKEVKFACPSFDAGSDGVWRFFDGHDPRFKLRYTNFVECTAPVLQTSMLLDPLFQPCLRAVRTGCFIDFCFHPAAGGGADAVAVIDAVRCYHPPRGADAPSEMRQVQAWEDHKSDNIYFEREGVPKEWWCIEPRFFQPRVFGAVAAEASGEDQSAEAAANSASRVSKTGVGSKRAAGNGNGQLQLPSVGFGTAFYPEDHLRGSEEAVVTAAVEAAVRAGVRLFDCANQYTSQRFVGAALSRLMCDGQVSREELVIVAKLAHFDSEAEVSAGVQTALDELQLDYVDVLMPHIPPRPEAWQWFEAEVRAGRARHLGVSNYDQLDTAGADQEAASSGRGVTALRELLQAAKIRPVVHEFELHPLLQSPNMVEFCQAEGIQILSYSPLGAPHKVDKYVEAVGRIGGAAKAAEVRPMLHVLQHPGVVAVASFRRASPAQVVLAWHIQRGFVPIPKSWDFEHVELNAPASVEALSLGPAEMNVLDSMDDNVRTVVLYHKGVRGEL